MIPPETIVRRPRVARQGRDRSLTSGVLLAALLGAGVFTGLDARRAAFAQSDREPAIPLDASYTSPPPEPLRDPEPVARPGAAPAIAQPVPVTSPSMPQDYAPLANAPQHRASAPALIVDFTDRSQTVVVAAEGASRPASAGGQSDLNPNERFASRLAGTGADRAQARHMGALDTTVPQGAVIETVLETAINSDVPGFARAIVARDVYGFDGSQVLIPRGSRVIGQYKSGVALGASRVFVIWSRIIRPDGVSIELASPATDSLGRGGLGGKVDRHFLQRFGGAIMLSVLDAGMTAAAAAASPRNGTGIFVNSANDASNMAAEAMGSVAIPPTIKTPQGTSARIFVARDLDFSGVGAFR